MSYIVIDTETTGMDPAADKVVEIAGVSESGAFAHTLVSPNGVPISFGAMAVHHITNEMVQGAPTLDEAVAEIGIDMLHPETPLVFHHADFDRAFLPLKLRQQPWICTYRCALHLVPEAESHSNGALWYELGLSRPMPEEAGKMPHRALFDALMTADLFKWMLGDSEPSEPLRATAITELIRLSTAPVVLAACKFGKHRGEAWADIPSDYMRWVLKQDFDPDTHHTCQHWLSERGHG